MASFKGVATAITSLLIVASIVNDFVTCNPVKRTAGCDGAQCTLNGDTSTMNTTTPAMATAMATCTVDPDAERRTILLEGAATTWAATLPPMLDTLREISDSLKTPPMPYEPAGMDCTNLYTQGYNTSGIYKIGYHAHSIVHHEPFYAYCDMVTDGGGWTVFQQRFDGSTNFYRGWKEYINGFGHLNGEHWLGLKRVELLSSFAKYELRIDLKDFAGNTAFAKYDNFHIGDEIGDFKMSVSGYSGTAGDGLDYHNEKLFTTKDHDNDDYSGNCASRWGGAWWYYNCHRSNLNGLYLGQSQNSGTAMVWQSWRSDEALKVSAMKMRRKP